MRTRLKIAKMELAFQIYTHIATRIQKTNKRANRMNKINDNEIRRYVKRGTIFFLHEKLVALTLLNDIMTGERFAFEYNSNKL